MTDGFRIAELYGRLNDADEAVKSLERAFQERHSWLIYLNSDPAFDGVRGDPRFKALVKKVGLPTGTRR